MDSWCSGGVPTAASVGIGDGEVLVGRAHRDERDGQVRRDAGHDELVHAHVAQDGQHLGAVHRRDALVARQHEVVGPDADLGHDLERGVRLAPVRRRRGGPHERRAPAGRAPAGEREVGQVHHLHARAAGAGGEAAHGGQRRPGRLGQGREHGEVADDAALALDEEQRRRLGIAHAVTHRSRDPGRLRIASNLPRDPTPSPGGHESRPSSAHTRAVSAPSAGAGRSGARALGSATGSSRGTARPGPATPALTPAIDTSRQPAAACGQRVEAGVRRRQPGERVGDGVGAEERRPAGPGDQAAGQPPRRRRTRRGWPRHPSARSR